MKTSTGGYIKMAKTENFERNFFYLTKIVSKSREISRYPGKFPIFAVLTLLPGGVKGGRVNSHSMSAQAQPLKKSYNC